MEVRSENFENWKIMNSKYNIFQTKIQVTFMQNVLQELSKFIFRSSAPDAPGGGFQTTLHPVHPAKVGCAHGRSSPKPPYFADWYPMY